MYSKTFTDLNLNKAAGCDKFIGTEEEVNIYLKSVKALSSQPNLQPSASLVWLVKLEGMPKPFQLSFYLMKSAKAISSQPSLLPSAPLVWLVKLEGMLKPFQWSFLKVNVYLCVCSGSKKKYAPVGILVAPFQCTVALHTE